MNDPSIQFKVGDKVRKHTGDYLWPGVVVSVFPKLNGNIRIVVECTVKGVRGALHIFSPKQLRKIEE